MWVGGNLSVGVKFVTRFKKNTMRVNDQKHSTFETLTDDNSYSALHICIAFGYF